MRDVDAVVIGAGINGMVAAAELGRAGWSVALVERGPEPGGFIASGERTLPGYTHDVFSSWHPLFTGGAAYAELGEELARHGLEYRNTDGPLTATVGDDGRTVVAYRSPERTAEGFAAGEDRDAYLAALGRIGDNLPAIGALMGSDLRTPALLREGARLVRALGVREAERWARDLVTSGRAYCRREFRGGEVDRLWVPWLLHAGLAPDSASGGFMLPMLAASLHGAGLPVVRGGAGRFVEAFRGLLAEAGVEIIAGTEVTGIVVQRGRAYGVRTAAGPIKARRAVLAGVPPTALYGELLPPGSVPPRIAEGARRYRFGRAAVQIHVALSEPPGWRDEVLARVPLFHVSDGSASTAIACAEAEAGLLPRRPTIVVGQQHVLDPDRVPEGAAALWLQLQEAPYAPAGDAAGELDVAGGWTAELARGYADRVLARLAEHAPGLPGRVRAMDVLTPADLARHNPNAVHGDPYSGSAELDQNFRWRSVPGLPPLATGVAGLLHIGASAHPGPGLSGGSGHIAAQRLLRNDRWTPTRWGRRLRG